MVRHAVVALAVLLAALAGPQAAQAQGVSRGLRPMPPISHPGNHPPGNQHPFHHVKFNGYPYWPYWGMGGYAQAPVVYTYYVPYEPEPVYVPVPAYGPSEDGKMDLGLPPMPSVVPYPGGRYVLMGDGVSTPYRWVWIPDPPSAPPAEFQEKSSAPPATKRAEPIASRGSALYRWEDDQGVVHFTQGWDAVPERYRAQVRRAGAP